MREIAQITTMKPLSLTGQQHSVTHALNFDRFSVKKISLPVPAIYIIQWNIAYRTTLKSNNSEFDQNIWVKNISMIEQMFEQTSRTAENGTRTNDHRGNPTRPNGWPSLPEKYQLASVRVDLPLNGCLILCFYTFFASFLLIIYM